MMGEHVIHVVGEHVMGGYVIAGYVMGGYVMVGYVMGGHVVCRYVMGGHVMCRYMIGGHVIGGFRMQHALSLPWLLHQQSFSYQVWGLYKLSLSKLEGVRESERYTCVYMTDRPDAQGLKYEAIDHVVGLNTIKCHL